MYVTLEETTMWYLKVKYSFITFQGFITNIEQLKVDILGGVCKFSIVWPSNNKNNGNEQCKTIGKDNGERKFNILENPENYCWQKWLVPNNDALLQQNWNGHILFDPKYIFYAIVGETLPLNL